MTKTIKKIGVLTAGGDCPGLNAVIRAVTKTAINRYGLQVMGIEDGFAGLIHNRIRPIEYNDVSNILTQGGTVLGSNNKADPKRWPKKNADGSLEFIDVTPRCLDHILDRQLDAIIVIGGDGSMTVASGLLDHGINCIGVPKTIDNDLVGTDITFGFSTAVHVASSALDRVHTTAASHHRAMVVEVMGRNAGWLALHAGVASGADVILIPEIEYDIDLISQYLHDRSKRGKRFSIICVSEGAKAKGGEQVVARRVETSVESVRLGGVGQVVAQQIEDETGIETRAIILGHVQRGGTPTADDRVLATQFGHAAMELLMSGATGRLVVQKDGQLGDFDMREVANKQRTVTLDAPLVIAARDLGTNFGDQ